MTDLVDIDVTCSICGVEFEDYFPMPADGEPIQPDLFTRHICMGCEDELADKAALDRICSTPTWATFDWE